MRVVADPNQSRFPDKKSRRDFSTARFRLKTIGANQASVFFVALADF
jgi:hypothetical protein